MVIVNARQAKKKLNIHKLTVFALTSSMFLLKVTTHLLYSDRLPVSIDSIYVRANMANGTDKMDLVEKPGLEPMWSITTIYRPGGDAITD